MNKDSQNKISIKSALRLAEERQEILSLPAEKALDKILDAKDPAAVVQSFPEEDLYFLVHDIGLEDSLELMSLASERQWEYMLDMDVWKKDRIQTGSATKWLDLLFRADAGRFVQWSLYRKRKFVEFYLFKNIRIIIREHDQDPGDFGEGFFTLDDIFYIRFLDRPDIKGSDDEILKTRDKFLKNFIRKLAEYDLATFQNVLLESSAIIPSESEEEDFRLRSVRLAEKGFLPFDEALSIYQPLRPEDIYTGLKNYVSNKSEVDSHLPAPVYTTGMLKEENLFTNALETIHTDEVILRIQAEFAGLCNQIISADQKNIKNRDELGDIVKKACAYISIGLERLAGDTPPDANKNASLIKKYFLSHIFRAGYTLCLELKCKAEKWRSKSWFAKNRLSLSFWDEEWVGALGGLLIKKPLFYDNYKTTAFLYREFSSIQDIDKTDKTLNEIIAFDNFLSIMKINFVSAENINITYKNLILTLWARNFLGLSDEPAPLTIDELKTFFDDLFVADESKKNRSKKTPVSMKESFLNWVSKKAGLNPYEIKQRVGQTLEKLFNSMESEYGAVATRDLDPKYIYLFLVSR